MTSLSLSIESRFLNVKTTTADVVKRTSHPEKVTLAIKLASLFQYIGSTSKQLLNNSKHLPVVGALKLVKLALVPITACDMGLLIFSIHKTTINEKVDVAFNLLSNVGVLTDLTATAAEGLAAVGVVATKAIKWVTPLVIIASVVEGIDFLFTTKNLIQTHRFSTVFHHTASLDKLIEEYSLEDFTKARELILEKSTHEKSFIGKHLQTNGDTLNERLLAIESEAKSLLSSDNSDDVIKGKEKLKTTMQLLSKRMTAKKWSDALNLLAISVSLIGCALLFSPYAPIGFVFLAISAVLSLTQFFLQKAQTSQFEQDLGITN